MSNGSHLTLSIISLKRVSNEKIGERETKTIDIRTDEIRQALKDPVKRILDVIKDALEATPAELSSDIIDRGIVLAGGGSQLRGLDQVLREKTGVPVNVADEPHLAIVKGCGAVIEDLEKYKHVLL